MKEILEKEWTNHFDEVNLELDIIEYEFRKSGCKICGDPKLGNGEWRHNGENFYCPHLDKILLKKMNKANKKLYGILNYIYSDDCDKIKIVHENLVIEGSFKKDNKYSKEECSLI